MLCTRCHLYKHSMSQVMPKVGGTGCDIYVLFDKPEEEDLRFQEFGHGKKAKYLENFLTSLGVENYKLWPMVRCLPYDITYDDEQFYPLGKRTRKPTTEEIDTCIEYFKTDVIENHPKVIITCGTESTQYLLSIADAITKCRGTTQNVTIDGYDVKVIPTYSPTYLMKNSNGDAQSDFLADLGKAKSIADGTWVDVMELNHLEYAKTYQEFKDFYIRELMNEDMLAYDIETNAEMVYSDKFNIIGFSLAKRHCGIYVCLESLEYKMSDDDNQKCRDLLVAILKKTPKIIVHNSLYERPATYYNLGYEMDFDKIEDTLVMAKLMLGGKTGAGLKPNAKKIGYPDWDADIGEYIDNFVTFLKRSTLVRYKWIFEELENGKSFLDFAIRLDEETSGYVKVIFDVILKYYDDIEFPNIVKLFSESFLKAHYEGIPGVIPYSWIPSKIICAYGATDSLATFDLYDNYMKRFDVESTDEVDLHKGYHYALMEHYAGYSIMVSGMYWDDELAQNDYQNYMKTCLDTIKFLQSDPLVEDYIVNKSRDDYLPDIIYENYNDYFWDTFGRRVILVDDKEGNSIYKMEYQLDNGKTRKKHIKHFCEDIEIPVSIIEDIDNKVRMRVRKEIETATEYTQLKKFFNPSSMEVRDVVTKVVSTDNTKVGCFINKVNHLFNQGDFDISQYNEREQILLNDIAEYLKITNDDFDRKKIEYEKLKKQILSLTYFESKELQKILNESNNLKYETVDDNTQVDIYNNLVVGSVDPERPETWNHEFKWIVDYRFHKKSDKIIRTYIEGTVGRKSLFEVDEGKFCNGDSLVYRGKNYYDESLEKKDSQTIPEKGKTWVEQTSFGVGTADTGRWRSAYHTIPLGSSIKYLYTSRFKGGTILQPDFSANELRCIASAANETNMLEAFANGLDIHKSNASRIFKVPMEEITSFQRRRAKNLSFATIYGASEYSVAQSYFNGDVKQGKKLLDDFYAAFPNLKVWMDKKHDEVLNTHRVSALTHRFLNIDFDPDDKASKGRALRQSVNFPVQSFHFDTEILGLDGKTYSIGQLADEHKDIWVYSYDIENQRIVPVKGIQAQCTGVTNTWYEIVLDNGRSVKVTPEHKMMLSNGEYERADMLLEGDSLKSLSSVREVKVSRIKVIQLEVPEKKYDLHIPKYHNFALGCGVFTHNSAASTIAAVILCRIAMYYKENDLKSKIICFIHDSLESDVAPYELIEVLDFEHEILAHGGQDYFGVACKADVSLGYSMGHECELSNFHILNDEKTEAVMTLEGFKNELYDTIGNWKTVYNLVDVIEEEYDDVYTPLAQTFITSKGFDPTIFSHREKGKMKVHIRYYDEFGNVSPMETDFKVSTLWDNSLLDKYLS